MRGSDDMEEEYEYSRPNKSQLKREAQEFLTIAQKIVALHESRWSELCLPDEIIDELHVLKNTKQFGAKKRQLKRVGKLLRSADIEVANAVLSSVLNERAEENVKFHNIEAWRDRLLAGDASVVAEFLTEYPETNAQNLNQLLRNAKREQIKGDAAKYAKLLFKLIKEIVR